MLPCLRYKNDLNGFQIDDARCLKNIHTTIAIWVHLNNLRGSSKNIFPEKKMQINF